MCLMEKLLVGRIGSPFSLGLAPVPRGKLRRAAAEARLRVLPVWNHRLRGQIARPIEMDSR